MATTMADAPHLSERSGRGERGQDARTGEMPRTPAPHGNGLKDPTTAPGMDLSPMDAILDRRKVERGALIPILQETQEAYGYLPRDVLARIANHLGVPFSRVYGVATFYSQFHLTRRGRNVIKVCDGTACHVRGAAGSVKALEEDLGVGPGQTTEDYQFTYDVVYCLGACALGPVAVVNGNVKGRCGPARVRQMVEGLRD